MREHVIAVVFVVFVTLLAVCLAIDQHRRELRKHQQCVDIAKIVVPDVSPEAWCEP